MGEVRATPAVTMIFAVFSRYDALLDRAKALIDAAYGPLAISSEPFSFMETRYYEQSMGNGLHKQFHACAQTGSADELPTIKLQTNRWEAEIAGQSQYPVARPVNIDPGYVDLGKLVLASTKDHAHRLYLSDGVYGEVTLHLRGKQWQCWPWTYPDYQRPDVQDFFRQVREHHRKLVRKQ